MATRPRDLDTALIMLELLKRIPRGRFVTATTLHQQLHDAGMVRSKRTIERHLNTLTEHFDIECDDRTRPHGYRWKSHSGGLSLPALSEQESLLLALAQTYLQNLLPPSLLRSMKGLFEQARINLDPHAGKKPGSEWLSKVRVVESTQPLLPPTIKPAVFEAVSTALYRNQWLTIDYRNAAGRSAVHRVMPLGLAQQGPRLYLACRYEGFDNERSLALHRIKSATVSGIEFKRPSEFSLQKYDDDGRFRFGDGRVVRLSFYMNKPSGKHLLETPLSKDQRVVEHDDHYQITATVIDSTNLTRWLNGYGEDVWGVERVNA